MTTPAEQFNLDEVRCPECASLVTGIFHELDAFPKHKSPVTHLGCPYPNAEGARITAEHFWRRRT